MLYGYDAARQTVNPNQKDDLDAIGRDTKIVIVKQAQKAIIKYVNENGNVELSRDEVVGKSGEAIDYSTNEKVSSYRRRGFELVAMVSMMQLIRTSTSMHQWIKNLLSFFVNVSNQSIQTNQLNSRSAGRSKRSRYTKMARSSQRHC